MRRATSRNASCSTSSGDSRLRQPAVEADVEHPPQPFAVQLEQLAQGVPVARTETIDQRRRSVARKLIRDTPRGNVLGNGILPREQTGREA